MKSVVFGDRSRFAIEIHYDLEASGSDGVVGYFAYWIKDRQIGDGGYRHLSAQFGNMSWTRRDCGHRDGGKLCGLSPRDVQRWWEAIILEAPRADLDGLGLPEDVARFNLMFNYDGVTAEPIFLIACECKGRLIWFPGEKPPPIVIEDDIERFEGSIKDAYAFMDSLHEQIGL